VFSKFNVVDHDGDVTLPGAFKEGAKVPLAGVGHNWDIPTIGYGIIHTDDKKAWIDGQINLKMQSGREHYESMKFAHENGVSQEYSYSYGVDKKGRPEEVADWPGAKRVLKELDVKEVSPVLLGAGIGTGTMAIKGRKVEKKDPASANLNWPTDGNAQCPVCGDLINAHGEGILEVHRVLLASRRKSRKAAPLSDEEKKDAIQSAVTDADKIEDIMDGIDPGWSGPWIVATYPDYVIARDDDGDGYIKISYTIDEDGEVTLGDSVDVEQTWTEKSDLSAQMKYADHASRVLVALRGFTDRSKGLASIRAKIGRQLSAVNRERIATTAASARAAAAELEALLEETGQDDEDIEKSRKVFLMKAKADLSIMALHLRVPSN
jgi:hypothetical protein